MKLTPIVEGMLMPMRAGCELHGGQRLSLLGCMGIVCRGTLPHIARPSCILSLMLEKLALFSV